jgi:hypothetical protein
MNAAAALAEKSEAADNTAAAATSAVAQATTAADIGCHQLHQLLEQRQQFH